ncbi:helix-turn-helix domain-containing protein [bacterium]|nr:helix-turn-helix domain-containing protein [bacterium]
MRRAARRRHDASNDRKRQCVRAARREQGLTQRELARRAGVSERLVLALELGDAPGIQLDKLMSVTQALGIRLFAEPPLRVAGQTTGETPVINAPSAADAAKTDGAVKTGERLASVATGGGSTAGEAVGTASDQFDMLGRYRSLYAELARATREGGVS